MKKLLCLLIVLAMATALLCACDNNTVETSNEVSESDTSTEQDNALVPHLGNTDKYKDKTITILSTWGNDGYTYGVSQFWADETNSDPVNDAVYERNAQLKNAYGFNIQMDFCEESFDTLIERVRNDMDAGTVTYNCIATGLQTLFTFAAENRLVDYYAIDDEINHISFDSAWWDQAAQEDLSIKNKMFVLTGDIVLLDDEYTQAIFYNKDIIDNNSSLESPTQLVYDKAWTLDKMKEMCKAVAQPSPTTGTMEVETGETVWGFVGCAFDTFKLVLGCACPQVSKDSNDIPVLAMGNQRNVDAYDKAYSIIGDESIAAYLEHYYRWNDYTNNVKIANHFYNGNALFYSGLVSIVNSDKLRNANIRYGILPMPKYDEAQEAYATTVDPYHCMAVSIMNTTVNGQAQDLDFITFALEAMAYTGREYITPEYYDRTLKGKRILDDDDSAEMLDIIFSNRQFDISVCYNWNDCIQFYNQCLTSGTGIASHLDSKIGGFEQALNQTLEAFNDD